MTAGTRPQLKRSLLRSFLGMLTEVAFACGLIALGFLIAQLFFVGR